MGALKTVERKTASRGGGVYDAVPKSKSIDPIYDGHYMNTVPLGSFCTTDSPCYSILYYLYPFFRPQLLLL